MGICVGAILSILFRSPENKKAKKKWGGSRQSAYIGAVGRFKWRRLSRLDRGTTRPIGGNSFHRWTTSCTYRRNRKMGQRKLAKGRPDAIGGVAPEDYRGFLFSGI